MQLGSFGRGDENMHFSFTLLLLSVGVVVRIRRKYAVGSPGPSDIETGIEWNRMRPEAKALPGSQGLEGISVSIGGDIRNLWKG